MIHAKEGGGGVAVGLWAGMCLVRRMRGFPAAPLLQGGNVQVQDRTVGYMQHSTIRMAPCAAQSGVHPVLYSFTSNAAW